MLMASHDPMTDSRAHAHTHILHSRAFTIKENYIKDSIDRWTYPDVEIASANPALDVGYERRTKKKINVKSGVRSKMLISADWCSASIVHHNVHVHRVHCVRKLCMADRAVSAAAGPLTLARPNNFRMTTHLCIRRFTIFLVCLRRLPHHATPPRAVLRQFNHEIQFDYLEEDGTRKKIIWDES